MHIRGSSIADCSLCEHSDKSGENVLLCSLGLNKDKCKKFKYDIFKYEPKPKFNAGKFSKEDFEI